MQQQVDRRRLTAAERDVEASLDFVAVIIVGPARRQWRYPGDNEGYWPLKIGTTRDPHGYLRGEDRLWEEIVGHALVYVQGQDRADRLQAKIEEMVKGRSRKIRDVRSYYDLTPDEALLILGFAVEDTQIDAFDFEGKRSRIEAEKQRRIRAVERERGQRRHVTAGTARRHG